VPKDKTTVIIKCTPSPRQKTILSANKKDSLWRDDKNYKIFRHILCQYQRDWLPGKTRLRNDLVCIEPDIKLLLTHYPPWPQLHPKTFRTLKGILHTQLRENGFVSTKRETPHLLGLEPREQIHTERISEENKRTQIQFSVVQPWFGVQWTRLHPLQSLLCLSADVGLQGQTELDCQMLTAYLNLTHIGVYNRVIN